ncbi:MAG: GNAT family N-acetyltransferase [Pseudomonadota bacterium]
MESQVVTLRTSTAADVSAIDRLLSDSYSRLLKADYPPSVQVTAVPIISRANPSLISSGTYYLAVTPVDEIIGGGGWTRSVKSVEMADVRHIVTDYRHLRRGIARRIMMGIISEARRAGIKRLDCLATRTARPFYDAMGFETLGEITVGLRPGIDFPTIRMQRSL